MARVSLAARLARIAGPLEPAQAPYYVNSWRRGHPAFGWYIVLGPGAPPRYLGHNHIQAEVRLLELRELEAQAA